MEEINITSTHPTLVDVVTTDPSAPDRPLVLLRQTLHELVQAEFVDEGFGDGVRKYVLTGLEVIVQIRHLKFVLEIVEGGGKLVGDSSSGHGSLLSLPLFGHTRVLGRSVLADLLLDILDVALV